MRIIYVIQVLFGWSGSGSMTDVTFSPTVFPTYEECNAIALQLEEEAKRHTNSAGGTFYYVCRPSVVR